EHYINKDIFAYVTTFQQGSESDTTSFSNRDIGIGDTAFYSNGFIVLNKAEVNPANNKRVLLPGESAIMLDMTVFTKNGATYPLNPVIALNVQNASVRYIPDTVLRESLVVQFSKVQDTKKNIFEIGIKENSAMLDLMTLKVYEFPFIGLVWLGIIIMVLGFILSIVQRLRIAK
ncbi:MAG TPA: cytochrome c assembly protein, partial [Chitinophagaceae bacterium]|nr:cytochrome c assembly protein [Chitinophagaceae bacterium]